jgi:hypothetical protein
MGEARREQVSTVNIHDLVAQARREALGENQRLRAENAVMAIEITELRGAVGDGAGQMADAAKAALAGARREALEEAAALADEYLGPDSYCAAAIRALKDKP